MHRLTPWLVIAVLAVGCAGDAPPPSVVEDALPAGAEARSLLGEPLFPPPLSAEVRLGYEQQAAAAREAWEANPDDLEATIWHGRRTAYLGRYREAIAIYSAGLLAHPESHELLRHRGHRYLTVRELDRAVADLEQAAGRIAGLPEKVEADGLPNARNIPTGTSHSNIWYHLGLAYYLEGDFTNAARCYRECLKFSNNPDMLCATSYWLYITLRRLGEDAEAAALLEPIHADLDVIENEGYHRLLLLYRGELGPADLLPDDGTGDSIEAATTGYGVAAWHLFNGRSADAQALFARIVAGKQWAAFGYLAAEAELARLP